MTQEERGGPSPTILARLKLSEEVVEGVRAEREARRRGQLSRVRESGVSRYITISESPGVTPREALQNYKEVLRIISAALGMSEEELEECRFEPLLLSEVEPKMYHPIFRAFAEGFGQEALRRGDLEIGITALDLSSETGIMGNQPALDFIIANTGTSEKRLTAAEIVQALVNQRVGNPPPPRVTV